MLESESHIYDIIFGDFFVKAAFKFIHENYVCFVMEYMSGGDFNTILHDYSRLDENSVRFYIAELVLALENLHNLGIVHRDIKPDNLLLDSNGHLKLTDFGLSEIGMYQTLKKVIKNTQTCDSLSKTLQSHMSIHHSTRKLRIIGTPDYIAPEVIL